MSRQYFDCLLVLVGEAIGVDRRLGHELGEDVLAEVVVGRAPRVGLERRHEMLHVEDVDAHRRQHLTAGREVLGLLEEAHQPVVVVDLHHAEAAGFLRRNLDDADGRRRAALAVDREHPRVVHLVDVIAREHDQMARVLAQDRVEVLIDRVGRAEIPVLADALLRAEDLDELAELVGDDAPSHADVAAERERLVLQRDEDLAQARVDAVAEREVDDPVRTAEVDGRLGPLLGQRIETLARASRQNHDDDIVLHATLGLPIGPGILDLRRKSRSDPGLSTTT